MGMLSRWSTLVKSEMNRILENAEDPRETLDFSTANPAKRKMLEGKPALGAEVSLGSPMSAESLSRMAFDFVLVDTQHGRWDDESTLYAFKGIGLGSAMPMARARRNDFGLIGRLLDMGAMGVVAPMVNNVDEARMVVQATHYPPLGGRSFGPFGAEHLGPDYDSWIDDELFVAVQIETADGHKNAEAILAVDGIDGCWIGPNDLSRSMGIEMRSPAHEDAILEIIAACKKVGKIPGISTPNATIAQKWIDAGCLFVTAGEDWGWVTEGAEHTLRALGRG